MPYLSSRDALFVWVVFFFPDIYVLVLHAPVFLILHNRPGYPHPPTPFSVFALFSCHSRRTESHVGVKNR